jgi:hypothetical protein
MPPTSSESRCPRCLQAAPPRTSRCPHCRERLVTAGNRHTMLVLGGIGLLFLALVVAAAIFLKPFSAEVDDSGQQSEQSKPAPAPKKPPLN